eukprot:226019-Chlamydomonas_euryale.AAC.2
MNPHMNACPSPPPPHPLQLPQLEDRLACARLMASFRPRAAGVHASAATLRGACSEVCGNPLLHLILKIALIMGNFLNAGAPQARRRRGQGGALARQGLEKCRIDGVCVAVAPKTSYSRLH